MRQSPVFIAALVAAFPAAAQMIPPPGARPLSEVIAVVEAMDEVAFVLEVDWDDDGYWEIEFVDANNHVGEIRIDPVSTEEVPRRRR